jgi:hypothetical protein
MTAVGRAPMTWCFNLAREEAKWRHGLVMERVTKVEMIFLKQWRVRVGRFREGSLRQGCRFNALVLIREGSRWDKVLSKDDAEVTSSSWLNGKEAWHGAAA